MRCGVETVFDRSHVGMVSAAQVVILMEGCSREKGKSPYEWRTAE